MSKALAKALGQIKIEMDTERRVWQMSSGMSVYKKCIDILEKAQADEAPIKPIKQGHGVVSDWWFACGECHAAIDYKDGYCPHCGREVDWNE